MKLTVVISFHDQISCCFYSEFAMKLTVVISFRDQISCCFYSEFCVSIYNAHQSFKNVFLRKKSA